MKVSKTIEELSNVLYESNPKFNDFLQRAYKDGVGCMQVENDGEVKFFDIDEVKNGVFGFKCVREIKNIL